MASKVCASWSAERARELHIRGTAALSSVHSILSAEDLAYRFARLATDRARISSPARHCVRSSSIRATVRIGDNRSPGRNYEARCVVNAAGLFPDEIAAMLGNHSWKIYPVRGEYCEIRGPRASLIQSLVYPLPHADGLSLGVHFTKTLWGTVLLGPSAAYVDGKDNYERNRLPIADFAESARTLLPEVKDSDLQLGYSGLRPKLVPPTGKGIADFVITRDPNVPQAIQLVGIESPGLTAAPAIARHVAALVAETLH
jgi:glycerol-3-phosphate dehydrogenase